MLAQGCHDVFGAFDDEDLVPGSKQSEMPGQSSHSRQVPAPGDLEDTRRWRKAEVRHGRAIDVHDHACGAVDAVVIGGGNVADPANVWRHLLVAPALASKQEALFGCK